MYEKQCENVCDVKNMQNKSELDIIVIDYGIRENSNKPYGSSHWYSFRKGKSNMTTIRPKEMI